MNRVKQQIKSGNPALGMMVRLVRSPDIVRIAKTTGHDFLFIDAQHSIFDLETIGAIAQVALGCDIDVLVRVSSVEAEHVGVLLDNGVAGIVFPDVKSADDARRAVQACRFAPLGSRSVTGGYPHFDFQTLTSSQAIPALEEACLVVCMIECPEGLRNIEEICAVPGIDVVHFGAFDFAARIGKPGQILDSDVVNAQRRVITTARLAGKFAGCAGNRSVEHQAQNIHAGAQFIVTQSDMGCLLTAAKAWTDSVRKSLEPAEADMSRGDQPPIV